MKYLIVYSHPNPKSFNHAIKQIIEEKFKNQAKQYDVRDLYGLKFNPVLSGNDFVTMKEGKIPEDIKTEQEYIRNADKIIFIHPIWWFGMPSVLKGYIDRVFSYGFAYEFGEKGIKGLLTDKKVILLNTTGGTEDVYMQAGFEDAIKKTIEKGIFEVCGMKVILHKYFHAVPFVSNEVRDKMLEELKAIEI
jgi:NAD(P)H dehydrogenase (quinone)